MYFTESARLAERHPDLAVAFERLDSQLNAMGTAEVIRHDDLASFLNIEPNQTRSALDLLAQVGVLHRIEMIECVYCQMATTRSEYQAALEEDNEYRCTSCDRRLADRAIRIITAFARGEKWGTERVVATPKDSREIKVVEAIDSHQAQTAQKVSRSIGSDAAVTALLTLKDRKGWTMEELARHLGTTSRTLQSFRIRRTVRSSVFRTMADRLGVTPEDLLAGKLPENR